MIFTPDNVKKIVAGQKTQTRRIIKPDEGSCRYQPGKSYALQPGRGKRASHRITITDVRQEQLGMIDLRDARREGFRTTLEFRDAWTNLHGRFNRDQPVWVITFVLGDHTDTPRLLAARIGGAGGDYTTIPALSAHGEGEALTEHEQARMSAQARTAEAARAHQARSNAHSRPLAQRIRDVERARIRSRIDVTREMRVLTTRVDRAERALGTGDQDKPDSSV